jgi:hypothetical protein
MSDTENSAKNSNPDPHWPRGWDGHERQQLKEWAKLPLSQKLEWSEQAYRIARKLAGEDAIARRREER